jgi:hypothetical protein
MSTFRIVPGSAEYEAHFEGDNYRPFCEVRTGVVVNERPLTTRHINHVTCKNCLKRIRIAVGADQRQPY